MVIANAKTNALALGDFSRPGTLVALIGLGAAVVLQGRRVPGAIFVGDPDRGRRRCPARRHAYARVVSVVAA
jgi:Permeases